MQQPAPIFIAPECHALGAIALAINTQWQSVAPVITGFALNISIARTPFGASRSWRPAYPGSRTTLGCASPVATSMVNGDARLTLRGYAEMCAEVVDDLGAAGAQRHRNPVTPDMPNAASWACRMA